MHIKNSKNYYRIFDAFESLNINLPKRKAERGPK